MIFKRQEKINTSKEYQCIAEVLGEKMMGLFADNKAFLAGGAIRSLFTGEQVKDWDIFFPTKENYDVVLKIFEFCMRDANVSNNKIGATCVSKVCDTKNALTLEIPLNKERLKILGNYGKTFVVGDKIEIQLVHKEFLPIKETISRFDWTCVMAAFDFRSKDFYFDPSFFPDNTRKELVYNESHCPFSAFLRKQKFIDRGYTISMIEELKLVMRINQESIRTIGDFDDKVLANFPQYEIFKRIRKNLGLTQNKESVQNNQFKLNDFFEAIEKNPIESMEKDIRHVNAIKNEIAF